MAEGAGTGAGGSPAQPLIGREAELTRLAAVLAAARDGASRTLVMDGEPGIGKTSLLHEARRIAGGLGFTVLSARGVETEAELPFAGLGDALAPLLPMLDTIPDPQRAILAGALAIGPSTAPDRFAVCAGTLSLIVEAAERHPILILVDDAHWLDRSSAEALAFAARRLEHDRVAVLVAVLEGESSTLVESIDERLHVGGLDDVAAQALLSRSAPHPVCDAVAARLIGESRGSPLVLTELPPALSREQLAGAEPFEIAPGVPAITDAFGRRVRALPEGTQVALLAAALSEAISPELLESVCATLGAGPGAIAAAEDAGLLEIGARVEFRQPLVRAAVVSSAPPSRRRAVHAALAAAKSGTMASSWHLAAAAGNEDEATARELELAAVEATSRGGYAEAASALERAASLTPPAERRAGRLVAAALAARGAGLATRALRLLDEAIPLETRPEERARIAHLRGAIEMWRGRPREAHRLLAEAAATVEATHPDRSARMLTDGTWAAIMLADVPLALETGERARELAVAVGGATAMSADGALGLARLLGGDNTGAVPLLARYHAALGEIEPATEATPALTPSAQVLIWFEEYGQAREVAVRRVEQARSNGALWALPYALTVLADLDWRTGYWVNGTAHAAEAARLAEETGQIAVLAFALSVLARIDAARGRDAECRARSARALELGEHVTAIAVGYALAALGELELGLGQPSEAVELLQRLGQLVSARTVEEPNLVQWEPQLIEALVRCGRTGDAEDTLRDLERRATAARRAWPDAAVDWSHGMLDEEFDARFASALERLRTQPTPFVSARIGLAYGERLRRARRRRDAASQLSAALDTFERLGAEPWARRAAVELEACGETVRRAPPSKVDQLTPQELQITLLVAAGATNREAGAKLFLSPKTVEAHLGRVYRKLGVRSRTELAHLVATTPLA